MDKRSRISFVGAVTAAIVLVYQQPAYADAGVPMLVLVWPGLGLLLIPIIIAEAGVARYQLGLGWRSALAMSARANLVSTAVGVPITWALMLGLEFAVFAPLGASGWNPPAMFEHLFVPTLGAAWLPGEGIPMWYLPAAAAVLCVPFYAVSVWIEARVVRARLASELRQQAHAWSRDANRLTYGAIIVGLLGWAAWWAVRPPQSVPNRRLQPSAAGAIMSRRG
jgi:hypothetical protein